MFLRPSSNTAQLRGIIFQCWPRITGNICFVIWRNKCNKSVSSSMTQQHRIRIDLPNTAVGPKNRRKYMVSRGLRHVPREHGSYDVMFPGNITLQWRNRAILFIFVHHVMHVGPITIAYFRSRYNNIVWYLYWLRIIKVSTNLVTHTCIGCGSSRCVLIIIRMLGMKSGTW